MNDTKLILQQQEQILEQLASIEQQLVRLAGGGPRTAADDIAMGAVDPLELIRKQNAQRLAERGIKTSKGRRVR